MVAVRALRSGMTAAEILDALIAISDDKIWASELTLLAGGRRVDFWTLEPAASYQMERWIRKAAVKNGTAPDTASGSD